MKFNNPAIKHYYFFLLAMTEKEIKARYKKAVFGFLWVLLNPLLQMILIGLIFSYFINIQNYFLFLFSGLLVWQFFSLTLNKTTPIFYYERNLLSKAKFPKEVIPLSIIFANFFHLLASLLLLIIFLIIIQAFVLPNILLIIPALIWLIFITTGISLLTSSLNVKYRDINFFIQTILILWFYATPIIYNLSIVPENIHFIYYLNPLTSIFELFHIAFLGQGFISGQMLIANLIGTALLLIVGITIFRKESDYFVDWL